MKIYRTAVGTLVVAGLVGLAAVAQADLRALGFQGSGHRGSCCIDEPWLGYVVDRGRGWVEAENKGHRIQLDVRKGRVPLYPGERFRIVPLRRNDGRVIAELRHEGDLYAIVSYRSTWWLGGRRDYDRHRDGWYDNSGFHVGIVFGDHDRRWDRDHKPKVKKPKYEQRRKGDHKPDRDRRPDDSRRPQSRVNTGATDREPPRHYR